MIKVPVHWLINSRDERDLAGEVEELRAGAAVEAGVSRGGPRPIGRGGGGGLLRISSSTEPSIGREKFSDGWPERVEVPGEVRDAACRARVRWWRRLGLRKRGRRRVCLAGPRRAPS